MSTADSYPVLPRPSRGQLRMPSHIKIETALSTEAAFLPYTSVESSELLHQPFEDLQGYTAAFQQKYGVQPIEIPSDATRLVNPFTMGRLARLLKFSKEANGIYDPYLDISYTQEARSRAPIDQIEQWGTMAHEIGHMILPALLVSYDQQASTHAIREGEAERFAQGFMHEVYLPKYQPKIAKAITREMTSKFRHVVDGKKYKRRDYAFVNPKTREVSSASYLSEMRVADAYEKVLGPDGHEQFIRCGMGNDPDAVRGYVIERAGLEVWKLMTADPDEKPAAQVAKELEQIAG